MPTLFAHPTMTFEMMAGRHQDPKTGTLIARAVAVDGRNMCSDVCGDGTQGSISRVAHGEEEEEDKGCALELDIALDEDLARIIGAEVDLGGLNDQTRGTLRVRAREAPMLTAFSVVAR